MGSFYLPSQDPKKTEGRNVSSFVQKIIAFFLGCVTGTLSLLTNTEFLAYLEKNDKTIPDVLISWFVRTPPIAIESEVSAEERMLKIKQLLEQQDWQEADAETLNLLHWLVRTQTDEPFSIIALRGLPCRDLKTIDGLWTYYSKGRFGYSIQESIFEEVGKDIFRFGDQVGWRRSTEWIFSNDYDLRAQKGHLPSPIAVARLQRTVARLQRTKPPGAENLPVLRQPPNREPLAANVPIPKSCDNPR